MQATNRCGLRLPRLVCVSSQMSADGKFGYTPDVTEPERVDSQKMAAWKKKMGWQPQKPFTPSAPVLELITMLKKFAHDDDQKQSSDAHATGLGKIAELSASIVASRDHKDELSLCLAKDSELMRVYDDTHQKLEKLIVKMTAAAAASIDK